MMMSSTDMRGLSAPYGSWKMICIDAPLLAQFALASQPRDVVAVEDDVARGRRDQPDQQAAEGGLAAAGLADQAQRLAWLDAQRHVVDGAQRDAVAMQQAAGADREVLGQAGGLDQQRTGQRMPDRWLRVATRMQAAVWPGSNVVERRDARRCRPDTA